MAFDDGYAVHYLSLERGTPVLSSEEEVVGKVVEVRDNERESFLDGIVIDVDGKRRFVDAPEVARTAERAVTLTITAAEVEALPPPPPKGLPMRGRLSRFLRRAGSTIRVGDPPSNQSFHDHNQDDDDNGDEDNSR
jgi:hypothetical protein